MEGWSDSERIQGAAMFLLRIYTGTRSFNSATGAVQFVRYPPRDQFPELFDSDGLPVVIAVAHPEVRVGSLKCVRECQLCH